MRILGIDPGLNTTGYGIIDSKHDSLQLIEAGFIRTSSKQPINTRLLKIYKELTEIICRTKPNAVSLEKLYAHYKHPLTACFLGHARGVICLACAQKEIPFFEYAATRVKKNVLGGGHASKSQIQMMVLNTLGLKSNKDIALDVTDAIALAIAHSHIMRHPNYKR